MRQYFINLFNYDRYTNQIILRAINEAAAPEKPVRLLAHLLSAQQIWYNRCTGLTNATAVLWPDWKADTFGRLIGENHDKWIGLLTTMADGEFEKQINYNSLKGDPFSDKLSEILTHVINHGTHHRAQIGQHLKLAGLEDLPPTDYIFYLRQRK